ATAGMNETWTIKVKNLGPSDNAGYTVKDVLASGTTYVSSTGGCANASGTVTCTSSGLANGVTDTFTITVHISSGYTDVADLANTASIHTNATSDPAAGNDSSTSHTQVNRSADLVFTYTALFRSATAGMNETWTIKVKNL